ncbi:MAG: hypothetical protein HY866_05180 [Chloroflexi bacterium]|nr:hypothetical protein [Chloroflexota bacterium]
MVRVLTAEQLEQIISNTMVVMLVRSDLMADWRGNLLDLLQQARASQLDEEAIFVAAVLNLLYAPDDTLPTGTVYDSSWQSLLTALRTGVRPPAASESREMTLDRLLHTISEAVIAVLTDSPDELDSVTEELNQMMTAATKSAMREMVTWIEDALAVLNGTSPHSVSNHHQGVYATYWETIVSSVQQGE